MGSVQRLGMQGETVVEVLVSIAIATLVLSFAYASANRSFQTTRQTQDRGEALKLVESQAELLRSKAVTDPSSIYNNTHKAGVGNQAFCINTTSYAVKDLPVGTPNAILDADNFSVYNPDCRAGYYNYSIAWTNPGTDDLFTILARWDRIGGGRDEVKILYKLHP